MKTLRDLRRIYTNYLALMPEDLWAIDYMAVTALSCKGDLSAVPLFSSILAAPATGKTAIITPFLDIQGLTETYTEGTQNALSSGARNVKNSLIDKLDRRCLFNKDMTNLFRKDGAAWDIFSDMLRQLWDGSYTKHSGAMDDSKKNRVAFSFFGACTEILYRKMDQDADLGQRVTYLNMFRNAGERDLRFHVYITGCQHEQRGVDWKESLRKDVSKWLKSAAEHFSSDDVSTARKRHMRRHGEGEAEYAERKKLIAEEEKTGWAKVHVPTTIETVATLTLAFPLVNSVTRIRSGKSDIAQAADGVEGPARYGQQIWRYGKLRALLEGRTQVNSQDLEFMRIISHDTLTPTRSSLLHGLIQLQEKGKADLGKIAQHTHLPPTAVETLMNHWAKQSYVETFQEGSRLYYRLSDEAYDDLLTSNLLGGPTKPENWKENYSDERLASLPPRYGGEFTGEGSG